MTINTGTSNILHFHIPNMTRFDWDIINPLVSKFVAVCCIYLNIDVCKLNRRVYFYVYDSTVIIYGSTTVSKLSLKLDQT